MELIKLKINLNNNEIIEYSYNLEKNFSSIEEMFFFLEYLKINILENNDSFIFKNKKVKIIKKNNKENIFELLFNIKDIKEKDNLIENIYKNLYKENTYKKEKEKLCIKIKKINNIKLLKYK